jgi:hypothetical protein
MKVDRVREAFGLIQADYGVELWIVLQFSEEIGQKILSQIMDRLKTRERLLLWILMP